MSTDYLTMVEAFVNAENRRAQDSPADPIAFARHRTWKAGSMHEWVICIDLCQLRLYLYDKCGLYVCRTFTFKELCTSTSPRSLVTDGIIRARHLMKDMKNERAKPL